MVLLPGGPTHLDTFDLKPDAPAEIRGEFRPIATDVPGIDICELLPAAGPHGRQAHDHPLAGRLPRRSQHALVLDRLGVASAHGRPRPSSPGFPTGDWPSLGAVLSKQFGPRVPGRPAVRRSDAGGRRRAIHPAHAAGQPGYLGAAHAGFEVQAVDRRNIMLTASA